MGVDFEVLEMVNLEEDPKVVPALDFVGEACLVSVAMVGGPAWEDVLEG